MTADDEKVDLEKVDLETADLETADLESDVDGATEADGEDAADAADAADSTGDTAAEPASPAPPPAPAAKGGRPLRLVLPIALVLAVLLSAGAAAFTYVVLYRGDQKVDEAAAATVIQSASDGAVALLSYSPETLDKDFATAKSRLTGDFLNYYTQFTQEIVTPAAKQKQVKTSAAVVRSALTKIEPTSAEVLLFINQSTVSKENPDGSFTASSVKVEMTKVGDAWLISSFDPV